MPRYFLLLSTLLASACPGCRSAQSRQATLSATQSRQPIATHANTPAVKKTVTGQEKWPEQHAEEQARSKQAYQPIFEETDSPRPKPTTSRKPLLNPYEAKVFFDHHDEEHKKFGIPRYAKSQRKKKYGNSVLMQRSGRKRLYDHNIFLRALLSGKIHAVHYGNLGEQFRGGIFFDIGSAILFGEGAETVRDLYEDELIRENLTIVASDINDPGDKKSRFIDLYRKSSRALPFAVLEIPRLMDKPEHFTAPLKLFLHDKGGLVLRSANSGPDLYYTTRQVQQHLQSVLVAFAECNVLYLFNKFILYKPASKGEFLLIGEIDESVGINHKEAAWEKIDWSQRTFAEAVRLNPQHVLYQDHESP